MSNLQREMAKCEREFDKADGRPVKQARIMKRFTSLERRLKKNS